MPGTAANREKSLASPASQEKKKVLHSGPFKLGESILFSTRFVRKPYRLSQPDTGHRTRIERARNALRRGGALCNRRAGGSRGPKVCTSRALSLPILLTSPLLRKIKLKHNNNGAASTTGGVSTIHKPAPVFRGRRLNRYFSCSLPHHENQKRSGNSGQTRDVLSHNP